MAGASDPRSSPDARGGPTSTARLLYTTAEVAEMTGLTRAKLYQLCHASRIAHHRIDGQFRFTMAQVETFLDATRVEALGEPHDLDMTPLRARRRR